MSTAIGFNFATKQEISVKLAAIPEVYQQGYYCWLDLRSGADVAAAQETLQTLRLDPCLLEPSEAEDLLTFHDNCVEFTVTEGRFINGEFCVRPVKVIVAKQVLVTVDYHGDAQFLQRIRRCYHEDFVNVAQSPGFLLFEIADHLVTVYQQTMHQFSEYNESLQLRMFDEVDDALFRETADLISRLLGFRKILLTAAEVLDELVARTSPFLAETTKPHLDQKAKRIDSLCAEVLNERDALTSSLNLYLGLTGYRTNRIVQRLTAISMIFLPLSFLAGLYGMNFEYMPELKWSYGYAFFWGLVLLVLVVLLALGRRWKWL